MSEQTILDTAIPVALIGFALWLFLFKMRMGEAIAKAFEWCKENFKSKKRGNSSSPQTYSYIDYEG